MHSLVPTGIMGLKPSCEALSSGLRHAWVRTQIEPESTQARNGADMGALGLYVETFTKWNVCVKLPLNASEGRRLGMAFSSRSEGFWDRVATLIVTPEVAGGDRL